MDSLLSLVNGTVDLFKVKIKVQQFTSIDSRKRFYCKRYDDQHVFNHPIETTFNLEAVIEESIDLVANSVRDKNLDITWNVSPLVPQYIMGVRPIAETTDSLGFHRTSVYTL